jgi:hypothetical protein
VNVVTVEAKGDKAAILVMDDGSRVWTPEKAKADELIGKPIPGDWTQKQGEYGPQAFPPRERKGGFGGGGAAAWRNTKEGAAAEQERMDRRTALMQAVAYGATGNLQACKEVADSFYTWLRATAAGAGALPLPGSLPAPASSLPRQAGDSGRSGGAEVQGAGPTVGEPWGSGTLTGETGSAPCNHPSFKRGASGHLVCSRCGAPKP